MKYDQFRTNKLNMNDKWYTEMVMRPVRLFSSQIGQGVGARANKGWEGYERREKKGREVGALKRVGNWGGRGEIGRNYATILNISQTTRATSRLKEGSPGKSLGRQDFKARKGEVWIPCPPNKSVTNLNSFSRICKQKQKIVHSHWVPNIKCSTAVFICDFYRLSCKAFLKIANNCTRGVTYTVVPHLEKIVLLRPWPPVFHKTR